MGLRSRREEGDLLVSDHILCPMLSTLFLQLFRCIANLSPSYTHRTPGVSLDHTINS